jgi:hypothetical protein
VKKRYGILSRKWEAIVIGRMRREIFTEFSHDKNLQQIVWDSYLINMTAILNVIKRQMSDKRKNVKKQQENINWKNCRASGFER